MDVYLAAAAFMMGIVFLVKGSDWVVIGSTRLGYMFRIRPTVIALTIIAFGTSLPEFSVSAAAALKGDAEIAVGNVVGSCIANILLILGLSALIRPVKVEESTLRAELPVILLANILVLLSAWDGDLDRLDGVIMLLVFVAGFYYIYRKGTPPVEMSKENEKEWYRGIRIAMLIYNIVEAVGYRIARKKRSPEWLGKLVLLFVLAIGILAVILGAELTVDAAVVFADIIGIPEFVVALTLISVGTSLPELFVSSWASFKDEGSISTGNVIGSNLFNILFIMAVAVIIAPYELSSGEVLIIIAMVLTNSIMSVFLLTERTLSRLEGAVLLALYVGYISWVFIP